MNEELFKRRIRYIAARWGYSTHLFAWEWWNEENWTPIDDTALRPWIVEMTQSLKQSDPYQHLVTTSYADGSNSRIWRAPELDFMQQHDYSGSDPIGLFQSRYTSFQGILTKGAKPVLMGEHGADFRMVMSYWDSAAALVTHGAIDEAMFNDMNTEHVVVYAIMEPLLGELRSMPGLSPYLSLTHVENVVMSIPNVAERIAMIRANMKRLKEARDKKADETGAN